MFPRYSQILKRSFGTNCGAGKTVGFVGLGCMGNPMAANLVSNGFTVKGYDVVPEARAAASEAGIRTVETLAECASDVDYVVTALPKTEHVEDALMCQGGILENLRSDAYVCDTSTIDPNGAKRFNAEAKKRGLTYIDTPMSGGVTGAKKATLTFMVGGTEAEFEHAKGVLQGMGANFFHCGEPGSGEIAKLTNNLILGISMVAASEGMAIGEKLGIDPIILQKILSVSTARCWSIDTMNPRPGVLPDVPSSNDYKGGFAVGLIAKDMRLAKAAADTANARTDMLAKSLDYYQQLEDGGKGGKDFGYVFQYIMNNK